MKVACLLRYAMTLVMVSLCVSAVAQQPTSAPPKSAHIVNNDVILSPGEKFGASLTGAADGSTLTITEEPDLKKADVVFIFTKQPGMMLFNIENRTEYWLTYEAGIRVADRKGFYKTSVMPVGPRLSNMESWPYPIIQLAMKNFTFHEKPPDGKPTKK